MPEEDADPPKSPEEEKLLLDEDNAAGVLSNECSVGADWSGFLLPPNPNQDIPIKYLLSTIDINLYTDPYIEQYSEFLFFDVH